MTDLINPITIHTQTTAAGFDWTSFDPAPYIPGSATRVWVWVTTSVSGNNHSCKVYFRPNSIYGAQQATNLPLTGSTSNVSSDSNTVPVGLDPNSRRFEYKATVVNDATITIELRGYE